MSTQEQEKKLIEIAKTKLECILLEAYIKIREFFTNFKDENIKKSLITSEKENKIINFNLSLKKSILSGNVKLYEKYLELNCDLPCSLWIFKSKITSSIEKKLEKIFN